MRLFALAVATTALAASAATEDWGVPCVLGYCKGQGIEGVQSWMKGTHEGRTYLMAEHRAFDMGLFVYFTPKQGVCQVTGGSSVGGNLHGEAHMGAHRRFADLVRRKYGNPSSEEDFATHWRASDGARLPDGLQAIFVVAASSAFGSYVAVDYQFDNHGECVAEAQADIGADF